MCIRDRGVITNEYVQDARLVLGDPGEGEGETLLTIERVNRFGDEFSRFDLAVFGSDLYLRTDRADVYKRQGPWPCALVV